VASGLFLASQPIPAPPRVQARPATSPDLRPACFPLSLQLPPTTLLQIKDIRLDLQFVPRPRVSRLNVTRAFFLDSRAFAVALFAPDTRGREDQQREAFGGAPG
jgi:hypothetical protein